MLKYEFLPAGSSVDSKINTLYLDVGNDLKKGIIDHHQLKNIQKSATTLVYENKELIPEDLETIVLHELPDLDCIASSYLAKSFVENNCFPDFAKELCQFLDKVDFGCKLDHIISLSSLFSMLKSNCKEDAEIVQKGHQLIKDLSLFGFDSGKCPENYSKYINEIKKDMDIFQKDLKNSTIDQYTIALKNDNTFVKTEALILHKPKSLLFKVWARDIGYDLLIVKWNNKRVVISVKADGFLSLEGVGDRLNQLEKDKRESLDIKIKENNRVGYDMADPWYDGRAHGYTIIDAPRSGTLLIFDEILSCIDSKIINKYSQNRF